MSKRFSIGAGTVHAVLQKLGERPYVEVEGLINAIRQDVKPIDDVKLDALKGDAPKVDDKTKPEPKLEPKPKAKKEG